MINYAIGCFIVAALGGAIMALRIFNGNLAPWALSLGHAALGAGGLALVLLAVINGEAGPRATQALVVLVIAAVGGFFLASLHARKTVAPKAVVIVHALAAVAGLALLITAVM